VRMTPEHGEDFGHGVYASPGPDGELTVTSPRLDLGWHAAKGQVPGTAVLWGEHAYEVVGGAKIGRGARWTLRPWDRASAMRGVFKLEHEAIRVIADQAAAEAQGVRTRKSTVLLLPLLGLAPARLQKHWADEWGLNTERATQISAVCEMLVGSVGIIQVAASAFGADTVMPTWLAYFGVVLFASGFVRLALIAARPRVITFDAETHSPRPRDFAVRAVVRRKCGDARLGVARSSSRLGSGWGPAVSR
jgi:hypothetical protein